MPTFHEKFCNYDLMIKRLEIYFQLNIYFPHLFLAKVNFQNRFKGFTKNMKDPYMN